MSSGSIFACFVGLTSTLLEVSGAGAGLLVQHWTLGSCMAGLGTVQTQTLFLSSGLLLGGKSSSVGELTVGPLGRRGFSLALVSSATSVAAVANNGCGSASRRSKVGGVSACGRREGGDLAHSNATVGDIGDRSRSSVSSRLGIALRSLVTRLDSSGTSAVVAVHTGVAEFGKRGSGNDRLRGGSTVRLSELGLVDSFGLRRRVVGRRGGGGGHDRNIVTGAG